MNGTLFSPNGKENEEKIGNKKEKKIFIKKIIKWNSLYLAFLLLFSISNLILGFLSIHYSIFDLLMKERIKMRPGMPPMENWRNFGAKVLIKTYLYGVTNSKEFESGIDVKLKLKEFGPIVYEQTLTQEDIVFEKDSTLSFTTVRNIKFVEALNEPNIMNQSLIIVNPLLLPMASLLNNNALSAFLSFDDAFLNRTIYQTLWECSSRLLDLSKTLIPIFLPTNNCGILYNAFKQRRERYNVRIGTENGFENFWKINTINDKTTMIAYDDYGSNECPSLSVVNASDGTGYSPFYYKDKITFATPRIPRTFDLNFEKVVKKGQINAHKYVFSKTNLIRANDSTRNCLSRSGQFELPDGLVDASMLAFNMPIAISNPHFYGFNGEWENYIEGLSPSEDKHLSYILLEPKTGFPLEARASLQSNIVVPQIHFIPKLKQFSNKIIPSFWIEQSLLSTGKEEQIAFLVNILPILQAILSILFFVLSILFYVKFILRYNHSKKQIKMLPKSLKSSNQSIIMDKKIIEEV